MAVRERVKADTLARDERDPALPLSPVERLAEVPGIVQNSSITQVNSRGF